MKRTNTGNLHLVDPKSDPTTETDKPRGNAAAGGEETESETDELPPVADLAAEQAAAQAGAPVMSPKNYPTFLYHITKPAWLVQGPGEWVMARKEGFAPLDELPIESVEQRRDIVLRG